MKQNKRYEKNITNNPEINNNKLPPKHKSDTKLEKDSADKAKVIEEIQS